MFRHLLKLTWKRKSRNLMLSLEILLAFAIVFGVAAFGLRYAQLYRMPLGFEGADVWFPGEIRIKEEIEVGSLRTLVLRQVHLGPLPDTLFTKAWIEAGNR